MSKAKETKKVAPKAKKETKASATSWHYDVLRAPVITEKSQNASALNKVTFRIAPEASKKDVAAAVEAVFGAKVEKVNVLNRQGKIKRFRGQIGRRNHTRFAIVTLAEGQQIDLTSGI